MSTLPAMSPRGVVARVLRSVLVGLAVAVFATSAHLAAGGRAGLGAVVGVLVVATAVAASLTGRRLSTGQLVGLLALGQLALHVVATSAPHDGRMLLAHAAATAVSLLALRHAEDVWWRVADAAASLVRTPASVAVPVLRDLVHAPVTRRRGRRPELVVRGRAPPRAA